MIATWKELNESINSMSEADVILALEAEVSGKRRWTIVRRLHQRRCAIRSARERAALKALCVTPSSKSALDGVQLDNGEAMHEVPDSQTAD